MADEEPERPALLLEPKMIACPLHMSPFRRFWPTGWLAFATKTLDAVMCDEAFQKEAGSDLAAAHELLKVKPLCCRLPKDALLKIYEDVYQAVKLWTVKTCDNCRQSGLGGPNMSTNYWGRRKYHRHICLQCIVYRSEVVKPKESGG